MRSHTNAKMQSSAESNIKLTFLISGHKRFVGRSPTMPWWIEHLDETRSASIVTQTAHNQRTTMRQMLAADSLDGLCIQTSIYSSFTQRLRMNIIRSARHSKKLQAFLVAAVAGVTVATCCYYCCLLLLLFERKLWRVSLAHSRLTLSTGLPSHGPHSPFAVALDSSRPLSRSLTLLPVAPCHNLTANSNGSSSSNIIYSTFRTFQFLVCARRTL